MIRVMVLAVFVSVESCETAETKASKIVKSVIPKGIGILPGHQAFGGLRMPDSFFYRFLTVISAIFHEGNRFNGG